MSESIWADRRRLQKPAPAGSTAGEEYRKVEKLYDPATPAAGHVTRMTPASPDDWVIAEGAVPAIVTPRLWVGEVSQPLGEVATDRRAAAGPTV